MWLRTGFRWDGPEGKVRATQFHARVLLFQGRADRTVPIGASEALARTLGRQVTFVAFPGAGHVQAWNFEPQRYEAALRTWLGRVARNPGRHRARPARAPPRP